MNPSNLDRAYQLFRRAAHELDSSDHFSPEVLAAHLRSTAERVLRALEGRDQDGDDDHFSRLEHSANDIAEDLRRAERLIRERVDRAD